MSVAATCHNPSTIPRSHRRLYPLHLVSRVSFTPFCSFPTYLASLFSPAEHRRPLLKSAVVAADALSQWRIGAALSNSDGVGRSAARSVPGQLGLDELLSAAELICIVPPIICSIWCLISFALPGASKRFQVWLGSKVFVVQYFLLVGAVVIGSLIRQRQWLRICKVNDDGVGVDLIARIEKVEDDLRSSATIVRVLSRQLEKLGIRFRVTRKALKEPIAETATLAQKNSEATRALAMQEDILEKELGEIQKVLLAMQEQQQKQLELILAIGKAGKLLDSKRDSPPDQGSFETSSSVPARGETKELETQTTGHASGVNDI